LFLILYVVPNWPLPNSSWKVKMSLMSEVVRPRTEPFFDLAPKGPLEWIFTDFCFIERREMRKGQFYADERERKEREHWPIVSSLIIGRQLL